MSESEPEAIYDNVCFMDEYPELTKKVWLRRLAKQRLSQVAVSQIIEFPKPPDGAA